MGEKTQPQYQDQSGMFKSPYHEDNTVAVLGNSKKSVRELLHRFQVFFFKIRIEQLTGCEYFKNSRIEEPTALGISKPSNNSQFS
jgi:hypothetical protein